MSNYNGDLLDDGLQTVMGKDRCQNEWKPEEGKKVKKEVRKDKPIEAQWEPVREENWTDMLKTCAKWAIGFGGLSFLLFYWNLEGLMDSSVAVPSMCVCTMMAGFGIGKSAGGK